MRSQFQLDINCCSFFCGRPTDDKSSIIIFHLMSVISSCILHQSDIAHSTAAQKIVSNSKWAIVKLELKAQVPFFFDHHSCHPAVLRKSHLCQLRRTGPASELLSDTFFLVFYVQLCTVKNYFTGTIKKPYIPQCHDNSVLI